MEYKDEYKDLYFEDVEYRGEVFDLGVQVHYKMVNNGIGHYEFHGSSGYHEDWELEINHVIVGGLKIFDENGTEAVPTNEQFEIAHEWAQNSWELFLDQLYD